MQFENLLAYFGNSLIFLRTTMYRSYCTICRKQRDVPQEHVPLLKQICSNPNFRRVKLEISLLLFSVSVCLRFNFFFPLHLITVPFLSVLQITHHFFLNCVLHPVYLFSNRKREGQSGPPNKQRPLFQFLRTWLGGEVFLSPSFPPLPRDRAD